MRILPMCSALSRNAFVSAALAVLAASLCNTSVADEPKTEKVRIVLVGDSTVTDKGGWGLAFAALLQPGAKCVNLARSGHSSKSYYDQGYWKQALAQAGPQASGSVLASDGFFPFPDSVEKAAAAGVAAIIQPGGSVRDAQVIAAAQQAGMAMVMTGRRHFRH